MGYVMGILPGVAAVVLLNALLFGGPLASGYGSVFELYGLGLLPTNVRNYGVWIVQTQTALILLAFLPLFVPGALRNTHAGVSARGCLAALVGFTFLSIWFMPHRFEIGFISAI